MTSTTETLTVAKKSIIKPLYNLCKPRVVALMLVTAFVGMLLALPLGAPVPWLTVVLALVGIALAAGAGGVLNHLADMRIDGVMQRTLWRPIPSGKVTPAQALIFAFVLGISGIALLSLTVNLLTAILTLASLIGYALIYTLFLKYATPQNIVLGGLAGAMPPLLGWTAITHQIDPSGLLLVLIIFVWTPPHFWALAIYRLEEYKKAEVPMLPVTHGVRYTKLHIILYTLLLIAASLMPFIINMSGMIYFVASITLNLIFLYWVIRLWKTDDIKIAQSTFRYSIWYLFFLFGALLIDHYIPILT